MTSKIKSKGERMRRQRSNRDSGEAGNMAYLNRFDETDSALPPVVRARLYELFSQIEKELESVYAQNLALQEKVEGLTDRLDIGQDGQDIPDTVGKSKKGHQISQKLKTTYRLASTSKLVSSFRTSPSPFSLIREYRGHHDGVWEVNVMSTGNLIATASADHTVRVWCANSGTCLLQYTGHSGSVNSVRFHPIQSDLTLTASGDQQAHIWKASVIVPSDNFKSQSSGEDDLDGSEKEDMTDDVTETASEATVVKSSIKEFIGHTSVVSAADWMMGGGQVITASWDRTAILFDVETGEQINTLTGHDEELTELRSHPSQRLVVTCAKDATFRLWDMRDVSMKVNVFQGHTQPVTTAVFVGGDKIVSGSDDRTVKVWDLKNMRSPLTTIRTDSSVNRLAVSELQNLMAIPQDNRHIRVYDMNGTRLGRLPRSNRHIVSSFPAVEYGQLFYRDLEADKNSALKRVAGNFDATMVLSAESIAEISWWLHNVDTQVRHIRTDTFNYVITSDASKLGWGGALYDVNSQMLGSVGEQWLVPYTVVNINVLEIRAAFNVLQYFANDFYCVHINLQVDNTTAMAYVNHKGGSHSPPVNAIAKSIWKWCMERGIWLTATHIPGKLNVVADRRSRVFDANTEWMLNPAVFTYITQQFDVIPTVDLFAIQIQSSDEALHVMDTRR